MLLIILADTVFHNPRLFSSEAVINSPLSFAISEDQSFPSSLSTSSTGSGKLPLSDMFEVLIIGVYVFTKLLLFFFSFFLLLCCPLVFYLLYIFSSGYHCHFYGCGVFFTLLFCSAITALRCGNGPLRPQVFSIMCFNSILPHCLLMLNVSLKSLLILEQFSSFPTFHSTVRDICCFTPSITIKSINLLVIDIGCILSHQSCDLLRANSYSSSCGSVDFLP